MATGHGGNLRELAARAGERAAQLLDFSASVNPLGPPECLRDVLEPHFERLVHYPDPRLRGTGGGHCRPHDTSPREQIVVGNGSSEILFALARACDATEQSFPCRPILIMRQPSSGPAGSVIAASADGTNDFVLDWNALGGRIATGGNWSCLGQPNNPTGWCFARESSCCRARGSPATHVRRGRGVCRFRRRLRVAAEDAPANVIVVRSFTKFYAIARSAAGVCRGRAERGRADSPATDALVGRHAGPSGGRGRVGRQRLRPADGRLRWPPSGGN